MLRVEHEGAGVYKNVGALQHSHDLRAVHDREWMVRARVSVLLGEFGHLEIAADKNAKPTLHELCCAPPFFGHHGAANVWKTFCLSDGFISKVPVIMNVWLIARA